MGFENLKVCAVTDVFGERVPESGSNKWEGSLSPGPEIGSKWRGREVGIRGTETEGRNVAVEHVGEVARGLPVLASQWNCSLCSMLTALQCLIKCIMQINYYGLTSSFWQPKLLNYVNIKQLTDLITSAITFLFLHYSSEFSTIKIKSEVKYQQTFLSHELNTYYSLIDRLLYHIYHLCPPQTDSLTNSFKPFMTPLGWFLTLGKVNLSWMDMGPFALDVKSKTRMWGKGCRG